MPLDKSKLQASKTESREEIARYGEKDFKPYHNTVLEQRSIDSDIRTLEFMKYIIEHYKTFESEETPVEKSNMLFYLCCTVDFLSTAEMSSPSHFREKFNIKGGEFNGRNIFKDLRFLQKTLIPSESRQPNINLKFMGGLSEEMVNAIWQDVVKFLEPIIKNELSTLTASTSSTSTSIPSTNSSQIDYTKVDPSKEYPNIISISSYYREMQRVDSAIEHINYALLSSQTRDEHHAIAILRCLQVSGEVANTTHTTIKLPGNEVDLEMLSRLAYTLSHPLKYFHNISKTTSYILDNLTDIKHDLTTLRSLWENKLSNLKSLCQNGNPPSIDQLQKYYCSPSTPVPYYSDESIDTLKHFFKALGLSEHNKKAAPLFARIMSSEPPVHPEKELGKILTDAKNLIGKDKYKKFIKENASLVPNENTVYKREIKVDRKLKAIENLKKEVSKDTKQDMEKHQLRVKTQEEKEKLVKEFKAMLQESLLKLKGLAEENGNNVPSEPLDDNPIALQLESLPQVISMGPESRVKFDFLIPVNLDDGSSIKGKIELPLIFPNSFINPGEYQEHIKSACKEIKIEGKPVLFLPLSRDLMGITEYVRGIKAFTLQQVETYFQHMLSARDKFLLHIIKLSEFNDCQESIEKNLLTTEFYIQAISEFADSLGALGAPVEDYNIEHRIIRNALTHFEDSFDTLAAPITLLGFVTHYTIKFIHDFYEEKHDNVTLLDDILQDPTVSDINIEDTHSNIPLHISGDTTSLDEEEF